MFEIVPPWLTGGSALMRQHTEQSIALTRRCVSAVADKLDVTLPKVPYMLQLTPTGLTLDRLPAETVSIDVRFDDRRIWSIDVRDRESQDHLTLEWPAALAPYLRGRTTLLVVDSSSGAELGSTEALFDNSDARTSVTDDAGAQLVVNKWGWMGIALEDMSDELQSLILERSRRLVDQLTEAGYRPFVVGGTLLGGVRDGRLLPHDDDADIAYLSAHNNPADVAIEALAVGDLLEASGYEIRRHSATHMQLLFRDAEGSVLHYIDVFTAFFSEDGHINQPFHVRGRMGRDDMLPFGQVEISGVPFPTPANADRWLTINYDAQWRTPIPGFQLVTPVETRRRFENWFGGYNFQREFWDAWFADVPGTRDESQWDTGRSWLLSRLAESNNGTVVDLGCGAGELTHAIAGARSRVQVVGLDYSDIALARARTSTTHAPTFAHINFSRLRALAFTQQLGIDGPFSAVANHLMDQLGHQARANVWRILRMSLRSGGWAGFTFHAAPAPNVSIEDPTGWHLTKDQLVSEAAAYGLHLTFETLGPPSDPRLPTGAEVHLEAPTIRPTDAAAHSKEHLMTAERNGVVHRTIARARRALSGLAGSGSRTITLQRELDVERARVSQLEADIDELRRDSLRIAELIDLAEHTLTPITTPGTGTNPAAALTPDTRN